MSHYIVMSLHEMCESDTAVRFKTDARVERQ